MAHTVRGRTTDRALIGIRLGDDDDEGEEEAEIMPAR